jgi:hypothetical protein
MERPFSETVVGRILAVAFVSAITFAAAWYYHRTLDELEREDTGGPPGRAIPVEGLRQ